MDGRGSTGRQDALTRRDLIAAGAAAGVTAALPATADAARRGPARRWWLDFAAAGDGRGWGRGWRTVGVANLRREGGLGLLVAASDVFPNDPRPVAFAVDRRVRDVTVAAEIERAGRAPGVVVRRVAHRLYYAAIYDTDSRTLAIVRRAGDELRVLAESAAEVPAPRAPFTLELRAEGVRPTQLVARLHDAAGRELRAAAHDRLGALQRTGDPGVLATAQTYLADAEATYAPFGGFRLGLYGLQEGEALQPAIDGYFEQVEKRSTAAFRSITVTPAHRPRRTPPSVVAATTGAPVRGGALLGVAADRPARVEVELASRPSFRGARVVDAGRTGDFAAVSTRVRGLSPGERVWWRARVSRRGRSSVGPVRSFRVPPRPRSGEEVTLAIASCGSQFGPNFDHLAERRPDVFVWQGDLNYPDTHGHLAQTTGAYAGIWRDFLANPRLMPVLERACFAAQRDDHDYGLQDANAADRKPQRHGIAPWDALISPRTYYRFAYGPLAVWVLDQRRFKVKPDLPDTPGKTLLGERQRDWLMRTLARSRAPFKVICSPCTLHYGDNARDGNWGSGFTAERDLLLDHVAQRVNGRTIFVTGDSHDTMVYERDGVFEVRACPVGIPVERDHPGVIGPGGMPGEGFVGAGVTYADPRSHFCVVRARGAGERAAMSVGLVREDGVEPYAKPFEVG